MTRAEIIARYPNASDSFIAKNASDSGPPIVRSYAAAEDESELRERVRKDIAMRGWAVFCGTTAARTGRTVGECDLTLAASNGRVFFIELKTRTGKLSVSQQAVHAHLLKLGHKPLVIRSIEEFIEAVNKP